ncbi:hypothetical protein LH412_23610 [Yersinia intermedia]|uniref:hypothetical protein n=1 Tax=Yersinia intermedia TaxID=631 RepID=UPI001CFE3A7D|nr:hypothetical protein [Yersinia intermedia]MCB5324977.1 hypothetical protein [Yersinia intermedia]
MKTDHLIIQTSAGLFDVTLTVTTVPADDVGPAHKKYHYELPGGRVSSYGYTRKEALAELLTHAKNEGWKVLQPLN